MAMDDKFLQSVETRLNDWRGKVLNLEEKAQNAEGESEIKRKLEEVREQIKQIEAQIERVRGSKEKSGDNYGEGVEDAFGKLSELYSGIVAGLK